MTAGPLGAADAARLTGVPAEPRLLEAQQAPGGRDGQRGIRARVRNHFARWWPVWIVFAASRLGVLVVGLLSEYAASNRGVQDVLPFAQAGTFIHYADVATNGYTLENATQYPLLPALMAGLNAVGIPLAVGALLVVNLAFLVGLLGCAMLGERYVGREAAVRGATYLAIFPTSHFFSLASTESLMLAGVTVAALLALRGTWQSWLAAGVAAGLCALTRPPAAFVGLVLLGIAISQLRRGQLTRRGIAAAVAAGAAIPLAVLGFFAHLQARTGDFLAANHAQEEFDRSISLAGPFEAVVGAVRSVASGSLGPGFELAAAVLVVAALVAFLLRAVGERWEVRGWVAFGALSLLLPLATGLVWQMPRFALLVLPAFWMLGVVGRRQWLHLGMLILFPMALAFRVVFEVVGVVQ